MLGTCLELWLILLGFVKISSIRWGRYFPHLIDLMPLAKQTHPPPLPFREGRREFGGMACTLCMPYPQTPGRGGIVFGCAKRHFVPFRTSKPPAWEDLFCSLWRGFRATNCSCHTASAPCDGSASGKGAGESAHSILEGKTWRSGGGTRHEVPCPTSRNFAPLPLREGPGEG